MSLTSETPSAGPGLEIRTRVRAWVRVLPLPPPLLHQAFPGAPAVFEVHLHSACLCPGLEEQAPLTRWPAPCLLRCPLPPSPWSPPDPHPPPSSLSPWTPSACLRSGEGCHTPGSHFHHPLYPRSLEQLWHHAGQCNHRRRKRGMMKRRRMMMRMGVEELVPLLAAAEQSSLRAGF